MNFSFARTKNELKPISQLVLVILLIWLILPLTSRTVSSYGRFINPLTEQVAFHIDLTKQNTLNPLAKTVNFILQHTVALAQSGQPSRLIKSFLNINSFTRNSFYVHTTVNAP